MKYMNFDLQIFYLFNKAGIKQKKPPNYLPNIDMEDITNNGIAPVIFLPIKNIIYKIIEPNNKKIPLKATTDADTNIVHWFVVDGNFVEDTKTNKTLFITATSDKHKVKAIDDINRYSSSEFNVEYIF